MTLPTTVNPGDTGHDGHHVKIHKKVNDLPLDVKADFGAVGDGVTDDTAAIQNALNTIVVGANPYDQAGNQVIVLPAGTYKISASLAPPAAASNFTIKGDGRGATRIVWAGGNNPMLLLDSPWSARVRGLSLIGNATGANRPTYGIQVHRSDSWTGAGRPGMCTFKDLFVGGNNADMMTVGIGYTAEDADDDANNDTGTFRDVDISHCTTGYRFGTVNTLWHNIFGGIVEYCTTAIDNTPATYTVTGTSAWGGSYKCWGTSFAGNALTFKYGPATGTDKVTELHGINVENDTQLLSAGPWGDGTLKFFGGGITLLDPGAGQSVVWDASDGQLEFHSVTVATPTGAKWSFPTAGTRVRFFGGDLVTSVVSYNCDLAYEGTHERAGAPTYTNLGSGKLVSHASTGGSPTNGTCFVPLTTPSLVLTQTGASIVLGSYHDLDLSSVVPVGTKAVVLNVWLGDGTTDNTSVNVRCKGVTSGGIEADGTVLAVSQHTHTTAVYSIGQGIVPCDANRKVQYQPFNFTNGQLYIDVAGYYI